MSSLRNVVWKESGHITPQHFQEQARYYRDAIHFVTQAAHFAPYGLVASKSEMAEQSLHGLLVAALANGQIELTEAHGVFPTGLEFEVCPDRSSSPPAISVLNSFRYTSTPLTIYLSLPEQHPRTLPVTNSERTGEMITDINVGQPGASVAFYPSIIHLLASEQPPSNGTSLSIARVIRDSSGNFLYDPEFIPPCINIGASPVLMSIALRLINLLESKVEAVKGRAGTSLNQASLEIIGFLQAAVPTVVRLRTMCASRSGPPVALYLEMARLAGALCTFVLDSTPERIPTYDHDQLGPCFQALDQIIRAHLHAFAPVNIVTIDLQSKGAGIYEGKIEDLQSLGPSQWVLNLRPLTARFGESLSSIEKSIKVGSSRMVRELRDMATGGLPVRHEKVPPGIVTPRPFHEYFTIDLQSEIARSLWLDMERSRSVGLYVPEHAAEEVGLQVVLRQGERI